MYEESVTKSIQDIIDSVDSRVNGNIRRQRVTNSKVGVVQSVSSGTATVRFDGKSYDISGITIAQGLTVTANDRVRAESINGSAQTSAYVIVQVY